MWSWKVSYVIVCKEKYHFCDTQIDNQVLLIPNSRILNFPDDLGPRMRTWSNNLGNNKAKQRAIGKTVRKTNRPG